MIGVVNYDGRNKMKSCWNEDCNNKIGFFYFFISNGVLCHSCNNELKNSCKIINKIKSDLSSVKSQGFTKVGGDVK